MFKGFMFFMLGLVCLMGVAGGVENTIELSFYEILQLIAVSMCGISCMMIGVSYLNEAE
jgi:hypothetical protein